MKKTLHAVLLAIALLIGSDVSAQYSPFEFGIKVGANLSDYTGKGTNDTKTKFGFNAGVTVDYNFTPNIALLSGIQFTTKGSKIDDIDYTLEEYDANYKTSTASFMQIPIHAGYKLAIADGMRMTFHGGPYIAFGVGGNTKREFKYAGKWMEEKHDTFGDNGLLKRFDFGLGFGVNFEYEKFGVGIDWDFGLLDLNNTDYDGAIRTQNGSISASYKF